MTSPEDLTAVQVYNIVEVFLVRAKRRAMEDRAYLNSFERAAVKELEELRQEALKEQQSGLGGS